MDFLNILFPVIINLITLGAVLVGLFVGIKNGAKFQFLKLFFFAGALVGLYFLVPTLNSVIALESKLLFAIGAFILLIVISLIFTCIRIHNEKTKVFKIKTQRLINSAKPAKGIKSRKKIATAVKKALERPVMSKIFGAVFGMVAMVVMMFIAYMPLRPMLIDFADSQNITTTEYTLVEQIENTGVEDILVNLQGE